MCRFLLLLLWHSVVAATVLPQLYQDYHDLFTASIYKCEKSRVDLSHSIILHEDREYCYIIGANITNNNCTFLSKLSDVISNANELESGDNHMTKRDISHIGWFSAYQNRSSMISWYRQLEENYPDRVSIRTIGHTQRGRELIAILKGEWITGPVCMYISRSLATADASNSILMNLLKFVEFVIVPVANPDGYELTWSNYPKYRFWRKNLSGSRRPCLGVDLNRNFNIKWSKYGSSSDPCSVLYHGTGPESELEVSSIAQHLKSIKPLIGSIDFHSYSQEVLYPNAWTAKPHRNVRLFKYLAQWIANIASQTNTTYKYGQMGSVYLASGTLTDWLVSDEFVTSNQDESGRKLTPVSLTVELPPKKDFTDGFLISPQQIQPICADILPAVIKFTSLLVKNKNYLYV